MLVLSEIIITVIAVIHTLFHSFPTTKHFIALKIFICYNNRLMDTVFHYNISFKVILYSSEMIKQAGLQRRWHLWKWWWGRRCWESIVLYCNGCRGRSIGDIILMDRVPLLSIRRGWSRWWGWGGSYLWSWLSCLWPTYNSFKKISNRLFSFVS